MRGDEEVPAGRPARLSVPPLFRGCARGALLSSAPPRAVVVVMQMRAARTRAAVLRAAAVEIDRDGYAGTSLVRICASAGISLGALTFHFPAKATLADELQARGSAMTRAAVSQVLALPASPLSLARAVLLTVARLLEEEIEVRAAARLTRERPCEAAADWTAAWLPELHHLLEQAGADGQLSGSVDPEAVTALTAHLVTGVDAHLRLRARTGPDPDPGTEAPRDVIGQLAEVWDIVLYGASTTGPPRPERGEQE
ncbi:TetR family transcriptional regulator [Streptomyces violascens]|uniref:TetR family transcriptional regulator n=1 Tax=Streptomyces violascens TaxID=67381 RepID=UPI0037AA001A